MMRSGSWRRIPVSYTHLDVYKRQVLDASISRGFNPDIRYEVPQKMCIRDSTGGVIHCFSYGVDQAREYLDMGYFLGIGGVLTFKNAKKLKEVAEYAPMDRLVLETDCPYLTPVPYRGKRNSSLYLSYVAEALAELKGMERDAVIRVTAENARRLYRL